MKISYSKVEGYCNELHALAKKMKESLNEIQSIQKEITSSETWNGPASSAYASKLKTVASNFTEIYEELEYSILFMAAVSDGYQALDQNVTREICSNLSIGEPNLSKSRLFGWFKR